MLVRYQVVAMRGVGKGLLNVTMRTLFDESLISQRFSSKNEQIDLDGIGISCPIISRDQSKMTQFSKLRETSGHLPYLQFEQGKRTCEACSMSILS